MLLSVCQVATYPCEGQAHNSISYAREADVASLSKQHQYLHHVPVFYATHLLLIYDFPASKPHWLLESQ